MSLQDKDDEIALDEIAGQFWEWFWDAARGRQQGMAGWLALSATELKAWAEITGNGLSPPEWQILRDMDQAFLKAVAAKPEDKPVLTAGVFDAWFG